MEIFSIFGLLWNEVIIRPMLNTLMVLYVLCFSQMGVAIIVFTALVRILTIPLTVRQVRQMRAMTGLQPRVREIQQRHVGDRQRISQETMRLYRGKRRREPSRLSGSAHRADAHSHRPVPGTHSDPVQQSGRPGQSVRQTVHLDYLRTHSCGGAGQQHLPVAGLEPTRPVAHRHAHPGGGVHLGAAKDDADAVSGSASAIQPNHDAVDDAHIPGGILAGMAQRIAALLGGFQHLGYQHSVLHHRMGAALPTVPEARWGTGRSSPV